jgi:hypothetical protein
VADSLVTEQAGHDRHYSFASIKNGVLCSGIVYGVCGDAEGALRFIVDARAALSGTPDPKKNWEELELFVSRYRFPTPPRGRFGVLLSSRHSGTPRFYSIDSDQERIIESDHDVAFMGSTGVDLEGMCAAFLGAFLNESRSTQFVAQLPGLSPRDIAHFLVFFLYQQGFGDRSYELQQIGVGGYFNFVWQDADAEGRQSTGLYLIAQAYPERQLLVVHRHRIAFDSHPVLGELMVLTDKPQGMPAAWYVLTQNMSDTTISVNEAELLDDVIARHGVQPPFEVFVAGSGSVVGRRYCVWPDVRVPGLRPLADLTDNIAPQLARLLELMHEGTFEEWADKLPKDGSILTARVDPWKERDS